MLLLLLLEAGSTMRTTWATWRGGGLLLLLLSATRVSSRTRVTGAMGETASRETSCTLATAAAGAAGAAAVLAVCADVSVLLEVLLELLEAQEGLLPELVDGVVALFTGAPVYWYTLLAVGEAMDGVQVPLYLCSVDILRRVQERKKYKTSALRKRFTRFHSTPLDSTRLHWDFAPPSLQGRLLERASLCLKK